MGNSDYDHPQWPICSNLGLFPRVRENFPGRIYKRILPMIQSFVDKDTEELFYSETTAVLRLYHELR